MKKFILILFIIIFSAPSINGKAQRKWQGYLIPQEYVIVDSLTLNGQNTQIAIFSPYSMTADGCEKYVDKGENRILLIKRDSHFYRFDNVISNDVYGYIDGNESLKENGNGFELWFEKGQSCTFEYHIYIGFFSSKIKITHITLITLCNNKKKVKNIRYKNFLLKNFHRNLIDKLKNKYSM